MPQGEFPRRPHDLAELGKLLRAARKAWRGSAGEVMTLDELARRTGISKPYLSNIETARAPGPPSEEKLRQLAGALGLEAGSLVAAGDWLRTPESVRRAFLAAHGEEEVPRRGDGAIDLDRMLGNAKHETRNAKQGAATEGGAVTHGDTLGVRNVPLINRVAAGKAG
jgi:transcriptional regulator with XRE-family HTH domain